MEKGGERYWRGGGGFSRWGGWKGEGRRHANNNQIDHAEGGVVGDDDDNTTTTTTTMADGVGGMTTTG